MCAKNIRAIPSEVDWRHWTYGNCDSVPRIQTHR